MEKQMRKMVIVNENAGDQWFEGMGESTPDAPFAGGYPFGGSDVPVGRYILEDGKIKGQVLADAPLPKGHEQESITFYRNVIAYHLDPKNAFGLGTLPDMNPLKGLSPEREPEAWLENLCRVYKGLSGYREFDDEEFRPMPDIESVP